VYCAVHSVPKGQSAFVSHAETSLLASGPGGTLCACTIACVMKVALVATSALSHGLVKSIFIA
jgi:hypothetical protein